jgi:excisionase family DNA binding protein
MVVCGDYAAAYLMGLPGRELNPAPDTHNRIGATTMGRHTYITQQQAADILGVTDRTIRSMIADKRLKGYSLGARVIRLRLDEVEAALQPIGA